MKKLSTILTDKLLKAAFQKLTTLISFPLNEVGNVSFVFAHQQFQGLVCHYSVNLINFIEVWTKQGCRDHGTVQGVSNRRGFLVLVVAFSNILALIALPLWR